MLAVGLGIIIMLSSQRTLPPNDYPANQGGIWIRVEPPHSAWDQDFDHQRRNGYYDHFFYAVLIICLLFLLYFLYTK